MFKKIKVNINLIYLYGMFKKIKVNIILIYLYGMFKKIKKKCYNLQMYSMWCWNTKVLPVDRLLLYRTLEKALCDCEWCSTRGYIHVSML